MPEELHSSSLDRSRERYGVSGSGIHSLVFDAMKPFDAKDVANAVSVKSVYTSCLFKR